MKYLIGPLPLLTTVMLLGACGGAPAPLIEAFVPAPSRAVVEVLIAQAKHDLSCAEDLQVTTVDVLTRDVAGCGKIESYRDLCEVTPSGPQNCHWRTKDHWPVLFVSKEPRRSPI
jgi:hypothetical protein